MKRNLFLKSGISLLILAGVSMAAVSETSFDGNMYDELKALRESPEWMASTTRAERGAEGPIRSVDVQPAANDIYESLSKYQAAQQFEMNSSERGAQGRVPAETSILLP